MGFFPTLALGFQVGICNTWFASQMKCPWVWLFEYLRGFEILKNYGNFGLRTRQTQWGWLKEAPRYWFLSKTEVLPSSGSNVFNKEAINNQCPWSSTSMKSCLVKVAEGHCKEHLLQRCGTTLFGSCSLSVFGGSPGWKIVVYQHTPTTTRIPNNQHQVYSHQDINLGKLWRPQLQNPLNSGLGIILICPDQLYFNFLVI